MTLADRIARAIELLTTHGYRVTLLRTRGRPKGDGRTVDRELIQKLRREHPAMSQREIAERAGCSADSVSKILRGTR